MKILIKMALRNLRRNTRRTILTMSSIAFGLAVVLWLECILAGRNKSMVDQITSSRTGHIQLHRKDYIQDKLVQQTFAVPVEQLNQALPKDSQYSPRIYLPSMISSGEQSTTIMLMGIDPEAESQVTNIQSNLNKGEYLAPESSEECPSRQIYLGKSLADLLKVGVGNKVVLMTQAADNTLGNDLFRVKGIFATGSADMDKTLAYAPLNCVKKLGALTGIHELAVKLKDSQTMLPAISSISSSVDGSLKVSTWKEALPSIAALLQGNEALVSMISAVLFIVISLGTVNILLIGIFERIREFGVMIALGTTPLQLKIMVLLESLFLALGSSVLGTILGTLIVYYHMQVGFDISPFWGNQGAVIDQFRLAQFIYPALKIVPYLKSVAYTLIFVLIAALYPAHKASKLKPIEAMRSV
jgi:ABC-type lipoprotein release transport system permease subunit